MACEGSGAFVSPPHRTNLFRKHTDVIELIVDNPVDAVVVVVLKQMIAGKEHHPSTMTKGAEEQRLTEKTIGVAMAVIQANNKALQRTGTSCQLEHGQPGLDHAGAGTGSTVFQP